MDLVPDVEQEGPMDLVPDVEQALVSVMALLLALGSDLVLAA
jgi:hypothetical protein